MKLLNSVILSLVSVTLLVAQTPQQLHAWLPVVDGWTINPEIEVFDAENLFDRINGAAPLFIENNFVEMTSMEYTQGEDYITIQAYRHASPEDAFGMYASERTDELEYLPFAGEAQGDETSIFFFAGDIYVKMWSNAIDDVSSTLQTIAAGLAEKIQPDASYPQLFNLFPEEGKIPYTSAYITANYIGHEFLQGVYVNKYESSGQPFQLFVIATSSPEEAKDVLTKYFTFSRQSLEFEEGPLTITDRYNGDIPVVWKGKYIVGVFNENGDNVKDAEKYITLLADKL